MSRGACVPLLTSTEADAAAYLDKVLAAGEAAQVLQAFRGPKTDGGVDTQLLGELLAKAFGTMRVRAYDGTPKPLLYASWQKARSRPLGF